MTDQTTPETEAPRPVGVFTCLDPINPTQSCYALVENDPEVRRKHREWHADRHAKDEGQRKAIKARDEEIAKLNEAIGKYRRAVEGFEGQVQRVETPPAPIPIVIDRSGYTDEELAATPVEPDDDDGWGLPISAPTVEEPTAGEPAESPADVDSEVDEDGFDSTVKTSAFGTITRDF